MYMYDIYIYVCMYVCMYVCIFLQDQIATGLLNKNNDVQLLALHQLLRIPGKKICSNRLLKYLMYIILICDISHFLSNEFATYLL